MSGSLASIARRDIWSGLALAGYSWPHSSTAGFRHSLRLPLSPVGTRLFPSQASLLQPGSSRRSGLCCIRLRRLQPGWFGGVHDQTGAPWRYVILGLTGVQLCLEPDFLLPTDAALKNMQASRRSDRCQLTKVGHPELGVFSGRHSEPDTVPTQG